MEMPLDSCSLWHSVLDGMPLKITLRIYFANPRGRCTFAFGSPSLNRAYAAHCVALVRPNCSPGGRNFLGCLKIPPLGSQLRISPMLGKIARYRFALAFA